LPFKLILTQLWQILFVSFEQDEIRVQLQSTKVCKNYG